MWDQGRKQHLAHEAWHVVQQKQGRVQPTMRMKGVAINDDQRLEREAESRGETAWPIQRRRKSSSMWMVGHRGFLSDVMQEGSVLQRVKKDVAWDYTKRSGEAEWPKATEGEPPSLGEADPVPALRYIMQMMDRDEDFIRAHLKPQRWGGKGGIENIRPWPKTFEEGLWNDQVEKPMDRFWKEMDVGGTFAALIAWQEDEGLTERWIAPLLDKFPGQQGSEKQLIAQKALYDAILQSCRLIPEAVSGDWWEVKRLDFEPSPEYEERQLLEFGAEFVGNIYPPISSDQFHTKGKRSIKILRLAE